jgi:hypothetical protein
MLFIHWCVCEGDRAAFHRVNRFFGDGLPVTVPGSWADTLFIATNHWSVSAVDDLAGAGSGTMTCFHLDQNQAGLTPPLPADRKTVKARYF